MNTAAAPPRLLSAEEYARLPVPPNGAKQELVRGEVVEMAAPSFIHGTVQAQVIFRLMQYLDGNKIGHLTSESGLQTEYDPDTVRGPDVAFWSFARVPMGHYPKPYPKVAADLAIEIRSPDQRYRTLLDKVNEYFAAGVRAAWIVDPQERTITIYRQPGPGIILSDDDVLTTEEVLPGFRCQVAAFFPPAEG